MYVGEPSNVAMPAAPMLPRASFIAELVGAPSPHRMSSIGVSTFSRDELERARPAPRIGRRARQAFLSECVALAGGVHRLAPSYWRSVGKQFSPPEVMQKP